MKITLDTLTQWNACSSGKETFVARFPEGAEYKEVIAACDADGYRDYRNWIFTRAFQHLEAKEIVEAETDLIPAEIEKGLKALEQLEDGDLKEDGTVSKESNSQLAASGYYSRLAASGNRSRLAASGDDSRLAASGYYSRLAASGNRSQLAASGDDSQLAASGDDSRLAASGDDSRLAASGENSIIASAGFGSTFKLGDGGCAAIPYRDGNDKTRFAVAYVGENIEADTWYQVNAKGDFLKIEEQES